MRRDLSSPRNGLQAYSHLVLQLIYFLVKTITKAALLPIRALSLSFPLYNLSLLFSSKACKLCQSGNFSLIPEQLQLINNYLALPV